MKYKVGDKVRIREDLVMGCTYGGSVATYDMTDMCGNVVTIESVAQISDNVFVYCIVEDPDKYVWTAAMLEPVEEELTEKEAIRIMSEICTKQGCTNCPISKGEDFDNFWDCVRYKLKNPEKVIAVIKQYKKDHEKEEIEVEFACVVRVIEDTDKVKRCVYEEDVTEEKGEKVGTVMKRVLEEYCKEHEGKFFTVYEEICRVKE